MPASECDFVDFITNRQLLRSINNKVMVVATVRYHVAVATCDAACCDCLNLQAKTGQTTNNNNNISDPACKRFDIKISRA